MQTNHLDVYKIVAEKTGKDPQMYNDLGSFIFKETAQMLKDPSSLILKLKGIGSWHLRKKRMEIVVNEWTDRSKERPREEFSSDSGHKEFVQKHLQYKNFQERLQEYEKYLELKKEIRTERFKTQVLLTPNSDEKFKSE